MIRLLTHKAGMIARAFISRLRKSVGPVAVFGFVVAVIVPSLQGQPLGARAHVGEEVLKTVHPAGAYLDASSSVIFEGLGIGVVAASFHEGPAVVFGGLRSSGDSGAINECDKTFTAATSARDCLAASQFCLSNVLHGSADTAAPPRTNREWSRLIKFQNSKASKLMSIQIQYICHVGSIAQTGGIA